MTCVLTEGGAKFVTPMALAALSEQPVYTSLFDLKDEVEMGHIQLSRQADLIVVCPATANLMAKMASGIADDLATTVLLATDKPVMAVPAMNVRMWEHEATQRNVETLRAAGVDVMEPEEGAMACGEYGPGRLPEPIAVWQRIAWALDIDPGEIDLLLPPPSVIEYHPGGVAPVIEGDPDVYGPEDEPAAKEDGGGLGGLSASLISRGIQKAKEAVGLAHPTPPSEIVPPVAGGPVLSKKGNARALRRRPIPRRSTTWCAASTISRRSPFENDVPGQFPSVGAALAEPPPMFVADPEHQPLAGKHVLVTAGPTREPIDPVRYIANRSPPVGRASPSPPPLLRWARG